MMISADSIETGADASAKTAMSRSQHALTARRATRVLLVEDDAEMRRWVSETLGEEGFETIAAPDALTGLMSLLSDGADVVLTDWRMPGFDGLLFLESSLRVAPRTPVVFVTAYPESGLGERVRRSGAFSLLEKPFASADLVLHVRSALQYGGCERA